jgi:hypothetical protein
MYAIPLVARGRGVAVLYADGGPNQDSVEIDAIEALVRVAGLTVELLASASGVVRPQAEMKPVQPEEQAESAYAEYSQPAAESYDASMAEHDVTELHDVDTIESEPQAHVEAVEETSDVEAQPEPEAAFSEELTDTVPVVVQEDLDDESYLMAEPEVVEAETVADFGAVEHEPVVEEVAEAETPVEDTGFAFVSAEPETVEVEPVQEVTFAPEPEVAVSSETNGFHELAQASTEVAPSSNGRRSRRNVDLPIEVSDEERDKHKKARSFARLLVSEIKLYNPDKVNDGKVSNDLYERLREAIDRSREMYDQRIEAPVATRFDYFHYELVNGLADGDESRLGSNYPGAHA